MLYAGDMKHSKGRQQLAEQLHRSLPPRIRRYLNGRGIPDRIIDRHLIGWNGRRITIPVPDRLGDIALFRFAKDPENCAYGPKLLSETGRGVELYGWERVLEPPNRLVICEGEFDRLVLEGQGIPAVTSTGGAGTFLPAWADALRDVPRPYVCFDRDEAGRRGALRVAHLLPEARIVELPLAVGPGGDITDYFARLGKTSAEFLELLAAAFPAPPERATPRFSMDGLRHVDSELARLKASAPIRVIVEAYVRLRRSGARFTGRCPFHEDRNPSFVLYAENETYHCFGCGAHGDVIDFITRIENLSFPEALEVLRRLGSTSWKERKQKTLSTT